MAKTYVVIPTYNEAENLPLLSSAIFDLNIQDLEILIIEDNSPDGTGKVADDLARQYSGRFHVIHRRGKLGLGTAYVQGFQHAIRQGADYIVQMDADFSHQPSYLLDFMQAIEHCDVVVGSRYVPGGSLDRDWWWGRRLLSWWANSVWVRLALGLNTRDATSGFKIWRASALQRIHMESIRSNGYVFMVEMCYIAEKLRLRIEEIPIYFQDRRAGVSKMKLADQIESAVGVFKIRYRHYPWQTQPEH